MVGLNVRTLGIGLTVVGLVCAGAAGLVSMVTEDDEGPLPPQYSVVKPDSSVNGGQEAWVQGARISDQGRIEALVNVTSCAKVGRAWIDQAQNADHPPTVHVQTVGRSGNCAGSGWLLFADVGSADELKGSTLRGYGESAGSETGDGSTALLSVVDCREPSTDGESGLCELHPY